MKFKTQLLWLITLLLSSKLLFANGISIDSPYVRAIPPGQTISAAFMLLKNTSDKNIALIKASSDIADNVELHEHINEDGMMKMRQIPKISITAKGETALKPGGYHIMLIGLKKGIKPDDVIEITLAFDNGSEQIVKAIVKKISMGMMKHKGGMSHQSMAKNMQAMKHANPMPNLMKVIVKMADQLNLDEKQAAELKKWRDEHMPASKDLAKSIISLEAELHKAAMDGESIDKIDQLADTIMQKRSSVIHAKALCRDNMKSILSDDQYKKVLGLYSANFMPSAK